MSSTRRWTALACLALAGCALDTRGVPLGEDGGSGPPDATGQPPDAEPLPNDGAVDAAAVDATTVDAAAVDAMPPDAMPPDAMPPDAMPPDAMPPDAMPPDAMPPDAMAPTCPAGYTASGSASVPSSYRFVDSTETFATAVSDCANDLAGKTHLAIIDDATERGVVDARAGNRTVWIGITDAADEGTWLTVRGAAATYFNWATGEPNNAFGVEDCGEMQDGGAFNDASCGGATQRRYVCECDLTLP